MTSLPGAADRESEGQRTGPSTCELIPKCAGSPGPCEGTAERGQTTRKRSEVEGFRVDLRTRIDFSSSFPNRCAGCTTTRSVLPITQRPVRPHGNYFESCKAMSASRATRRSIARALPHVVKYKSQPSRAAGDPGPVTPSLHRVQASAACRRGESETGSLPVNCFLLGRVRPSLNLTATGADGAIGGSSL
jgi:hypothetical protein